MARIASDTDNTAVSCPLVHLTPPHTHIYIKYIYICTCQFYIPDSLAAGTLNTVDRKTPPNNAAGTFTLRLHFTSISCMAKNNKRKYNFTHISLGFFDEKHHGQHKNVHTIYSNSLTTIILLLDGKISFYTKSLPLKRCYYAKKRTTNEFCE